MNEQQTRAAFQVELAEHHHDAMKVQRNKKSAELRAAEHALDDAYFDLQAKREAFANIKSEGGK